MSLNSNGISFLQFLKGYEFDFQVRLNLGNIVKKYVC